MVFLESALQRHRDVCHGEEHIRYVDDDLFRPGGTAIPNANGPSLTMSSVTEADARRYTVKVTGDSSSASPITVESPPASLQVGAADSAAVDKFKSLPVAVAQAQLKPLGRGLVKSSLGSTSARLAFSTLGATKDQGERQRGAHGAADCLGGAV